MTDRVCYGSSDKNVLSVMVIRWSDASFLEDQVWAISFTSALLLSAKLNAVDVLLHRVQCSIGDRGDCPQKRRNASLGASLI